MFLDHCGSPRTEYHFFFLVFCKGFEDEEKILFEDFKETERSNPSGPALHGPLFG